MSKITTKSERNWTNFAVLVLLIIIPIGIAGGVGFKSMSPQTQYDTISTLKELFGPTSPIKSEKSVMEDVYYWTNNSEYWNLQTQRSQARLEELANDPVKRAEYEAILLKLAPSK